MELTDEQIERYSRNIILPEIGVEGQTALLDAKVLVVGAGGLGSPALLYLAAAGVGTIGIIDGDVVDRTNLQRQIIHGTEALNRAKVESAHKRLTDLNPGIRIEPHRELLSAANAAERIQPYDFVIDGTDTFASKFLINDACILSGKPFSHAGILRFHGQTMTVVPHESACLRCLFPAPPPPGTVPTCSEAGILGAIGGILGSIQATEAIKFVTGAGELLAGRLLSVDALTMEFRNIQVPKNNACSVCGDEPTITAVRDEAGGECAR